MVLSAPRSGEGSPLFPLVLVVGFSWLANKPPEVADTFING
ncbi:hypothetical protein Cha6605_4008 [Chamaesiphon minutus PCC 6605]|uniref:Uncharacterized protein n=1 Tax=Chamaesiphon minutus (strain ATCC 27169 / PCC 6605) TaxID=1173020 RepID=K9UJH1_CHAP6|nr:hypothetical protein Cha6605_4008 [Chamaesiphon minutus PCC 6605]